MDGINLEDVTFSVEQDSCLATVLKNLENEIDEVSRNNDYMDIVPEELKSCQDNLKAISFAEKINTVQELQELLTEQYNQLLQELSQNYSDILNKPGVNITEELQKSLSYISEVKIQCALDRITEQNDLMKTLQNNIKEFQDLPTNQAYECRSMLSMIKAFPKWTFLEVAFFTGNYVAKLRLATNTLNENPNPDGRSREQVIEEILEQLTNTITECNLLLQKLKTITDTIRTKNLEPKFIKYTELLHTLTSKPSSTDLKKRTSSVIQQLDELACGLEVGFHRIGYKHNAVTLKKNNLSKTVEVLHLTGQLRQSLVGISSSAGKGSLVRESIRVGENEKMSRYSYDQAFPNNIVVRRAKIIFKVYPTLGNEYHVWSLNCQHLTCYCVTGSFYCKHLNTTNDTFRKIMNTRVCRFISQKLNEQVKCLM